MAVLNLNSLHSILDQVTWTGEEIKKCLQKKPSAANEVQNRQTPLFRVLESEICSVEVVKLLLEYGAAVNWRNGEWKTPLMFALEQSRGYAIIATLLEKGADVSLFDHFSRGSTALCYALRFGATKDAVQLLLEAGCDPNACERHTSALHCASYHPNSYHPNSPLREGILEMLINAGANLLGVARFGQSPVCMAMKAGAGVEDIEQLLRLGASLNECQHHSSVWTCVTTCEEVFRRVHRKGIGWDKVLKSNVIELLIEEGARYVANNQSGFSPIRMTLGWRKYEAQAIKMLLDFSGADVNFRNFRGENLLHLAVENVHCDPSVIELLIERGTKANEVNCNKQTPLHTALYNGSEFWQLNVQHRIISILLKNSSPINAVDKKGNTPLRVAVESEFHSDIVRLLLSAGARIGVPNCGFSLLRLALHQYQEKRCQVILDSVKLLVKYYFLENPDFVIERLTKWKLTEILATELKHLADECALEVQAMKSTNIGDHRRMLLDLIRERSLPQIVAADQNPALSDDCLSNILRIMADNTISHFLADIAAVVGKSAIDKLQELQVYSIKKRPAPSHVEEKTILIYDCVSKVTSFLSQEDTMRLFLAFYVPANQTNIKDSVTNNMKRKLGEPENCGEC